MSRSLESVLLGTAVGDSLGLPAEGMSAQRIARRWKGVWCQRFLGAFGMVSDDTEHTVFVAQSLLQHPRDAHRFQKALAWKLRWWLLCMPAGIGFATLRAIIKLWLGFPPEKSGVFSAGNGPAMRSALLGAYFSKDFLRLREFVSVSTRLTHTDPRAETASLAVALTAAWCALHEAAKKPDLAAIRNLWIDAGPSDREWLTCIQRIFDAHESGADVREFACQLGLQWGVGGYAYHSIPVALYSCLHHFGDYRTSVEAVLNCGGDTDSVAAITGALASCHSPIPREWMVRLYDFPISTAYLQTLASALKNNSKSPIFPWMLLPLRNLLFLIVVLAHGFRRLVPI